MNAYVMSLEEFERQANKKDWLFISWSVEQDNQLEFILCHSPKSIYTDFLYVLVSAGARLSQIAVNDALHGSYLLADTNFQS